MQDHRFFTHPPGLMALLLLALATVQCVPKPESTGLKVGASVKNITPQVGAFIAGGSINRQFTGVHDSLYVKAVVVADAKQSVAILTVDCIGLLYPALQEIRALVAKQLSPEVFPPEHIVMSSTHTHAGPDVVGIWGPDQLTSGVDSVYLNELVSKAASAVVEAWNNRQDAILSAASTTFGEEWVFNISDSLSLDRSLNVLQFNSLEGKSIASFVNFACHPTILDVAANNQVSADYVHGLYTYLDEQWGGVNLFLQGAIGGWVQPEYEKKEFAAAAKRGRELGEKARAALQKARPQANAAVQFKRKVFQLPVSNPGFRQLAAAGVIRRQMTDSVMTEITWFSIGNVQFATHPGETTPVHSLETKALMNNQGPKIVIGLGMDALGYILSPNFFNPAKPLPHTEYQLSMSVDPAAGPVLMKNLRELSKP